jgi:cytochrome oxidase Cu insertion factor (SCO1/SenC/PrrC family)
MWKKRILRILVLAVPAIAIAAAVAFWLGPPGGRGVVGQGFGSVGGPIALVDPAGKPVTEKDFAGKYALVFFGYTTCPDVCPTELSAMATALDQLGPKADKVVPVFVTVDPERDTPEVVGQYAQAFSPRIVGLSGTPEQIAKAAKSFRVYYQKAPQGDGATYLMDHSAFTYLMGPEWTVLDILPPQLSPQDMAQRIARQL